METIKEAEYEEVKSSQVECPHCHRMVNPRLTTYQNDPVNTLCPVCGEVITDFTRVEKKKISLFEILILLCIPIIGWIAIIRLIFDSSYREYNIKLTKNGKRIREKDKSLEQNNIFEETEEEFTNNIAYKELSGNIYNQNIH